MLLVTCRCCCYIELCGTFKQNILNRNSEKSWVFQFFRKRHLLTESEFCILIQLVCSFFLRKSDQTFVLIIIGVNRPSELAFELESRPNPPRSRPRPLRPGPKLGPRPGYFNKLKLTQKNTYCSTEPLCAVLNWLWSWLRPLAKTQTKIQTKFWASNRKTQVIRPRPIPHLLGLEGTPTQTVFPGI